MKLSRTDSCTTVGNGSLGQLGFRENFYGLHFIVSEFCKAIL